MSRGSLLDMHWRHGYRAGYADASAGLSPVHDQVTAVAEVSSRQFWLHGYTAAHKHASKGLPNILDDDWVTGQPMRPAEDGRELPTVIPFAAPRK